MALGGEITQGTAGLQLKGKHWNTGGRHWRRTGGAADVTDHDIQRRGKVSGLWGGSDYWASKGVW